MHSEKSTTVENGSKEAAKCSPASPSTVDAHAQIGVLQQSSVPVDHRLGSDGALPPARPEFHVNSSNKNSDNNTNAVRNNDRSAILTDAEEVLPTTNCVRRLSSGLASSTTSLSPKDLASLVRTIEPPAGYNAEEEVRTAGRGKHKRQKIGLIIALISINFMFVFATWWWPQYYYIYLPFITITVFLNAVMVVSIIINRLSDKIFPEKRIMPTQPEALVFILPCYNESPRELTNSLDSLVNQSGIDNHPRAMMIICDGRVRGPECEKTSADYLLDDILTEKTGRRSIKSAYISWSRKRMDVEIQLGTYKGMPYLCIVKERNEGKRDSLIALRSFLYAYNIRNEQPKVIFSPEFFGEMAAFLANDAHIDRVSCLIGMDGDTVFADDCTAELLKESHYPNTVGVCGYVSVDFTSKQWGLWNIYQSAEYTIAQGLRRFHQSLVTHKVSCLPGCCQLLKVSETTCGDHILLDLFGYYPKPTDSLLKHIRATASEDRNHVCLMLSAFPKAQTRQALRARAYTDVPQSWSVFLSQRRRWTLGATSNDLFLVTAPGIQWFERILATANCLVWCLNAFVFASLGCLIAATIYVAGWIILCFASVMFVPVLFYICIIFWLPRGFREKLRYAIGCLCYLLAGPFINITVLCYSVYFVDSFGWGKTRKVVAAGDVPQVTTLTIDEEREIGLRPSLASKSNVYDTVAILGNSPYAMQLIKVFAAHHKIIFFDIADETLETVRDRFSGVENYDLVATAHEEELAKAKVYLLTTPPSPAPEPGMRAPMGLCQTLDIVRRCAEPGNIVMIESTVSIGSTRTLLGEIEIRGVLCGFSPAPSAAEAKRDLTESNKIISALNPSHSSEIERFYRRTFPRAISVGSPEAAEIYHLFESTLDTSHAMIERSYSKPDPFQLRSDFQMLSAMWKEFVIEADMGLEMISSTPEQSSAASSSAKEGYRATVDYGKQPLEIAVS